MLGYIIEESTFQIIGNLFSSGWKTMTEKYWELSPGTSFDIFFTWTQNDKEQRICTFKHYWIHLPFLMSVLISMITITKDYKLSQKLGCQNEKIKIEARLLSLGRCFRSLHAAGILGVSGSNIGIVKVSHHSYFFHPGYLCFKSKSTFFLHRQFYHNYFKSLNLLIPANILCLNKIILTDVGHRHIFSGILFISLKYSSHIQLNVIHLHV